MDQQHHNEEPGAATVVARRLGVPDLLIFRHTHGRSHLLLGGVGAGAAWAGTVAVEERDEPRLVAATEGQIVRVRSERPVRVIGPYFARTAAMVQTHSGIVVLGGGRDWLTDSSDEVLRQACAEASDPLAGIEPTRDLAHELHLYQRLRGLLTPPGDRRSTANHLARSAVEMLDAAFAMVMPEPGADLAVARPSWTPPEQAALRAAADVIVAGLPPDTLVIQDTKDAPLPAPLGADDGLVSVMIAPLTSEGFILAAHAAGRPRGFTSLDTDIGSLLAETASVALGAADATTTLDRHAERVRWLLRRDPVTGLPDRSAWDDALASTDAGAVVSVGMGPVGASDRLLQIVGAVLQRQASDTDMVARVEEGEFGMLLRGVGEATADHVAETVRHRLGPLGSSMSIVTVGAAASPPLDSVLDAWRVAAGRMLSHRGCETGQPARR